MWRRYWMAAAVAVPLLALSVFFGPSLLAHARLLAGPDSLNGDACQHVAPYLQYSKPSIFEGDYIARYFESCHPVGYRVLMRVGGLAMPPHQFSLALTYVLLAVCLLAAGWTGYRIGGRMAGWFVAVFLLSSPFFLQNMTPGMPRGFRSPLLALLAAGLVSGNPFFVAGVLVVAAVLDPTVTVAGGFALGWMLFVSPVRWRGGSEGWSPGRRVVFVAVTGLLIGLAHVPVMWSTRSYGAQLGKADWVTYPEAGPQGRTDLSVQHEVAEILPKQVRVAVGAGLMNTKKSLFPKVCEWWSRKVLRTRHVWWICGLCAGVVIWFGRARAAAWRLMGLLPASFAAYFLARWTYPRLFEPDRHLIYPLSLLSVLGLVAAFAAIGRGVTLLPFRRLRQRPWLAASLGVVVAGWLMLASFVCVGGRLVPRNGFSRITRNQMAFLEFAAKQPELSLFAGWPFLLDAVPLKAERRVLASYETLLPYHKTYVDEMRRRMKATLEAAYASDAAPLLRLRDEFGVTHLVADPDQYSAKTLKNFSPFKEWVAAAKAQAEAGGGYEVLRQKEHALVFENKALFVLDLSRIKAVRGGPEAMSNVD